MSVCNDAFEPDQLKAYEALNLHEVYDLPKLILSFFDVIIQVKEK